LLEELDEELKDLDELDNEEESERKKRSVDDVSLELLLSS
jgi:hypothetical protein